MTKKISVDASEDDIHAAVADFLGAALYGATFWTALELPDAKSKAEGTRRKRLGLKPGIPGIMMVHGRTAHFIEPMTLRGSLSDAQIDRRKEIIAAGGMWAVCRSVDQVARQLRNWGIPTKIHGDGTSREHLAGIV